MVKNFFKKGIAVVLSLAVLLCCLPVMFAMADFVPENVLSSNVSSARCVQFYPSTYYVGDASHISAETIAKLTDGDKATTYDCQTALDWDPPRYLGVEYTLDDTYYIGELKIYSGYTTSVDTFDVYASDSFETLYSADSLVASGVNCDGTAAQTIEVNAEIKYVTFLISGIELYCARIAEFEAYTACTHEQTEVRDAVEATCTEAGYTGDTYCLVCGEKIAEGEETALADHTVGDWLSDEVNHWHVCSVCEDNVDEAAHTSGEWIIDTPATTESAGHKHKECTVCGYHTAEEDIEMLSGDHTPGDINGDAAVNNKDLTRLFQYLSDWDVEVDETALDVNGDGSVNNKDLTRLFQFLSDWDVEIF